MSANLKALATALAGNQVQDIEDAMRDFLYGLSIDDSEGDQLDHIGEIVGEERLGKTDALYRIAIKIKIGENTSEGTLEKVITIWRLLAPGDDVIITEDPPAKIDISSPTFSGTVAELVYIKERLQNVLSGGVALNQLIVVDPTKFGFGATMGGFNTLWANAA